MSAAPAEPGRGPASAGEFTAGARGVDSRRRRFVAAVDLRDAPEARGMAFLRIGLAPIAYLEQNARAPLYEAGIFDWVLGALVVYGFVTFAMSFSPRLAHRWPVLFALLDLVFAALLVHASGGIASPLKFAFYVLPIGAALRLSPRLTAMWAVLSVLAYLAVTVRDSHTVLDRDADILFDDSLTLLWVSGAAIMLSALVGQRQRALSALAATRRALVQQTLDAEARERRRLAEVLHDDAIQNVLLARQELGDVERGVPGAAERTRAALDATSEQLRHEVFSMHPLGLERIGLGAVLRDLAETAGKRGGFDATVDVDPAAERCDAQELIGVTARELLGNVAKHAGASHVAVRVAAHDDHVVLTVTDDGRGIDPERFAAAVGEGHIGVAAMIERIEAVDGTVRFRPVAGDRPGVGGGTSVTVSIPVGAVGGRN